MQITFSKDDNFGDLVMIKPKISGPARVLAAIGILAFALALALASAAHAQRSPKPVPGGPSRGGDRGGGGKGLGIGGLILQLSPQILDGLKQDDDDQPRRKRPSRKSVNTQDDDDNDPPPNRNPRPKRPSVTKEPSPPKRLAAIPPAQLPPPTGLGAPPMPLSRAFVTAQPPRFKPDEIVVLVRGAADDALATQIAQGFNLVLQETLNFSLLPTSRVYRFSIPDGRTVEAVASAVAALPGVGSAEPNSYYWLEGGAKSEAFKLQYALPKMRVPAAQSVVSGKGITVAVIDSGVDTTHPSLKSAKLTLLDVVKGGVKGPDMHGTAITGIIAASGDLTGIAPGAKIIAARAFAPLQPGMPPVTDATTLATAVDQAFQRGARIFNMSFAGDRQQTFIEVIDAAYAQGAVFVAAAGNDGPDAPPAYPAAHDKVIAITATDQADAIYDQANRGGYVLAAAPGVDILAPVTGQGFDYLSGTSFAAAHVTGIIALLMERNPQLTSETIRKVLVEAAHDLGPKGQDTDFGAGLTDAYGALLLVGKK
jgi:subtilisin family serine protease